MQCQWSSFAAAPWPWEVGKSGDFLIADSSGQQSIHFWVQGHDRTVKKAGQSQVKGVQKGGKTKWKEFRKVVRPSVQNWQEYKQRTALQPQEITQTQQV